MNHHLKQNVVIFTKTPNKLPTFSLLSQETILRAKSIPFHKNLFFNFNQEPEIILICLFPGSPIEIRVKIFRNMKAS